MLLILALLALLGLSDAKVEFTYSMLFDEYDLNLNVNGVKEIPLEKCENGGCSVYIAASNQAMEATKNLFVFNTVDNSNQSLYETASGYDKTTGKMTGLHLASTKYTIRNLNTADIGPIVVWHVASNAPLLNTIYFEVYDGSRMNRPDQSTSYVTILTPEPYDLYVQSAEPSGTSQTVQSYIRATGFDGNNIRQPSTDNCLMLYDQSSVDPYLLHITSPIITISFDGGFKTKICAKPNAQSITLLDYPGIATSQGYIGCSKNGWQVFRSSLYTSTEYYIKDPNNADRDLRLDYWVTTKNTDKVVFTEYLSNGVVSATIPVSGTDQSQTRYDRAAQILVDLNPNSGSSYLLKYDPQLDRSVPTGEGICPNWVNPSVTSTTSGSTSTITPTTTSANGISFLLASVLSILFAIDF